MITCSDYIIKHLEDYGIEICFSVVGGGSMFLNQSFGNSKKIKTIFCHNEQSCAIAAEGYYRTSGKMAVVCVTSGPGGLNCLTGVMGSWTDSLPILFISGQVKYETTIASVPHLKLRQLGDQECDIISIVTPITKYAKMITNEYAIKDELEVALFLANSGRFGPCWLDIPLNIQSSKFDEENLRSANSKYSFNQDIFSINDYTVDSFMMSKIIQGLQSAKRPLIVAGQGIRLANAKQEFIDLINKLNIPVVTTFNGFDLLNSYHSLFMGRIGTIGTRSGNFALQNADFILFLGTRNNIRQVSYDWEKFASQAARVFIDIDRQELAKKTIIFNFPKDVFMHMDVKHFISLLNDKISEKFVVNSGWIKWCFDRKEKYKVVLEEYKDLKDCINPYVFIEELTRNLNTNAIVVAGNGTACVSLFQAGIVKPESRMFWNSGCAAMGYATPAAIGACFANNKKQVICIDGDGSFQMSMQEMQTIDHHNLPIKLFILNNSGYMSIIQTHNNFFNGKIVGCNKKSGVSFPNYEKLADTFNFEYFKIKSIEDMKKFLIDNILAYDCPTLIEVILPTDYIFQPKLSSEKKEDGTIVSHSLEDMFPFLSEEELKSNMIRD